MLFAFFPWAKKNPRSIFLLDGLGALLSVLLLGFVLKELEWLFGIPERMLYLLASFPVLFAGYDAYFYLRPSAPTPASLKGIATMNALYVLLSLGSALYYISSLTIFAWVYLLLEIGIVLLLATTEYKASKK